MALQPASRSRRACAGLTQAGVQKKATCRALFSKVLYLVENEDFLAPNDTLNVDVLRNVRAGVFLLACLVYAPACCEQRALPGAGSRPALQQLACLRGGAEGRWSDARGCCAAVWRDGGRPRGASHRVTARDRHGPPQRPRGRPVTARRRGARRVLCAWPRIAPQSGRVRGQRAHGVTAPAARALEFAELKCARGWGSMGSCGSENCVLGRGAPSVRRNVSHCSACPEQSRQGQAA